MQPIGFGEGQPNSAISSNTKDAARITIEISLFYTYILHKLPDVLNNLRYMLNGLLLEDINRISQNQPEKLLLKLLINIITKIFLIIEMRSLKKLEI